MSSCKGVKAPSWLCLSHAPLIFSFVLTGEFIFYLYNMRADTQYSQEGTCDSSNTFWGWQWSSYNTKNYLFNFNCIFWKIDNQFVGTLYPENNKLNRTDRRERKKKNKKRCERSWHMRVGLFCCLGRRRWVSFEGSRVLRNLCYATPPYLFEAARHSLGFNSGAALANFLNFQNRKKIRCQKLSHHYKNFLIDISNECRKIKNKILLTARKKKVFPKN